jgi:hypothetical protein
MTYTNDISKIAKMEINFQTKRFSTLSFFCEYLAQKIDGEIKAKFL